MNYRSALGNCFDYALDGKHCTIVEKLGGRLKVVLGTVHWFGKSGIEHQTRPVFHQFMPSPKILSD